MHTTHEEQEPLVSVLVIVFNDEDRLPRALRSVQEQDYPNLEVVVVDDCSTDRSGEVAAAFASTDPRFRTYRRPRNSGGCGAPRNDCLSIAQGDYVTFLDSDDELLPGALRRLVDAAETTGSPVVSAAIERFDPETGTAAKFRAEYYQHSGVFGGLAERDDLFYDTLMQSKLFRRELFESLKFPEDIHYEDQLMTAMLWTRIEQVTICSDAAYRWYIHRSAGSESITNQRHLTRNVDDRFEVNRRIDGILRDERHRKIKFDKFVRHDLALYAREFPDRGREYQDHFIQQASHYLATVPAEIRKSVPQPYRLAVRALLDKDRQSSIAAAKLAFRRGQITMPLRQQGGRWRWPLAPRGAQSADFDLTRYVGRALASGRLLASFHVTSFRRTRDGQKRIKVKFLGLRGSSDVPEELRLVARNRRTRETFDLAAVRRIGRLRMALIETPALPRHETDHLDLLIAGPEDTSPVPLAIDAGIDLVGLAAGARRTRNGNLSMEPISHSGSAVPANAPAHPERAGAESTNS